MIFLKYKCRLYYKNRKLPKTFRKTSDAQTARTIFLQKCHLNLISVI